MKGTSPCITRSTTSWKENVSDILLIKKGCIYKHTTVKKHFKGILEKGEDDMQVDEEEKGGESIITDLQQKRSLSISRCSSFAIFRGVLGRLIIYIVEGDGSLDSG